MVETLSPEFQYQDGHSMSVIAIDFNKPVKTRKTDDINLMAQRKLVRLVAPKNATLVLGFVEVVHVASQPSSNNGSEKAPAIGSKMKTHEMKQNIKLALW